MARGDLMHIKQSQCLGGIRIGFSNQAERGVEHDSDGLVKERDSGQAGHRRFCSQFLRVRCGIGADGEHEVGGDLFVCKGG